MNDLWSFLLQTLTASGVAVLLLVLKAMFRDKLSPRWQFAAWGVLAVVLLLPAGWNGRYTLLNWPFYVELLRSSLTGEYGALAQVTAPVPLPPLTVPRTAADWLFAVYVTGVVFFLVRYLVSYIRLRLALEKGRPVLDGRVRAAAEAYGLPACPAVEVDGLPSAFICGPFKPVLALPAGVETDEKVLLHELLHLNYHDATWGIIICLFRCFHWCNPLLWYCADQAGNDLESLCDQRVLERLEGENRRDYGRILLNMADEKYARLPGTSSMANGGKNIRRRIEAIARFKKYPAGMGLVSACVLLVLAVPLIVGAKAEVPGLGAVNVPAQMAYARTVPCATYAGAFDTYAKSVITGRFDYRAMCAPLLEQNALAENYRTSSAAGHWEWTDLEDIDNSFGYTIYNLIQVEEEVYEGLLVLGLNNAPKGESWDGTAATQWLAIQAVRAEKEGNRWVVIPQGEFRAVQGDERVYGDVSLPAQIYEAQWGSYTVRERWRTTSSVESYEQTSDWFGSYSTFQSTPIPDGEVTSWFYQELSVVCTGSHEDRSADRTVGVACMPLWGGEKERPKLRDPGPTDSSGGSSTGEDWGNHSLSQDWDGEVFISGGGSMRDGIIDPPVSYAADLYLNGEKTAELTLLPVEGGTTLD